MAVYQNLLLSAGGGIVSFEQQAEQEPNAANLLIGLGGTGVDCLRAIKTQVYSRLKPDDPRAIVPEYRKIRFLGVDSDNKNRGETTGRKTGHKDRGGSLTGDEESLDSFLPLESSEFFSIANAHVKRDLEQKRALEDREELSWLRFEDIKPGDMTIAGAGGIRQIGRYMLMDKSSQFISRIEQEINAAKSRLDAPTVNVHIFSGLSGGTGSGAFLDVCYMVRYIAKKLGGITVFGYFFLPDVNLSRIPYSNTKVRAYIPCNGYAAMQELDYCMQLKDNGGAFVQQYQGYKIDWNTTPVDYCHLVCATDTNNNVIPNAYEYAMNVTAEYVMDFLTQTEGFTLESQLSNFRRCVNVADSEKRRGMCMEYCVIGASCARLPLREINTYLASELFTKFATIVERTPAKEDVEQFAMVSLGKLGKGDIRQLYGRLTSEMQQNFDFTYEDYLDDYRFVLNGGHDDMWEHYVGQTASKRGLAQRNACSMQSTSDEESLIGRIKNALVDYIRDIEAGPMFAHGLLSAAKSHSMLDIVDGLIEENRSRWDEEAFNTDSLYRHYESARRDFMGRRKREGVFFDNDKKRFATYKSAIVAEEQNKLACKCYQMMEKTLKVLRRQIEDEDAHYYARLSDVVSNLVETFEENRAVLARARQQSVDDSFSMPLVTIDDLKKPMDEEIEKVSVKGSFSTFMGELLDKESEWLEDDDSKICRLVIDFFVKTSFGEFARRSMNSFLMSKYKTSSNEELENRVYDEWMVQLRNKAHPLFYFNGTVWKEEQTSKIAFLSVPATSLPVLNAAQKLSEEPNDSGDSFKVRISSLNDRIFVMSSAVGLPLSSYNNCNEYEEKFFSVTTSPGSHYYEGKRVPGMEFDDWRKLPPLTPQSLVDMDRVPNAVENNILAGRDLFGRAEKAGLFDEERGILRPTSESLEALNTVLDECELQLSRLRSPNQIVDAQQALSSLEAAGRLVMEQTGSYFPMDGPTDPTIRHRMFVDHFICAPAYQILVEKILREIEEVQTRVLEARSALEARIKEVETRANEVAAYCEALFTGVLSYDGFSVVYHHNRRGRNDDKTLSIIGDKEYPYNRIPLYQGLIGYKSLNEEYKYSIQDDVNEQKKNNYTFIKETGEQLKGLITEDKINLWVEIAETDYTAVQDEIIDFIDSLSKRFDLYLREYDI